MPRASGLGIKKVKVDNSALYCLTYIEALFEAAFLTKSSRNDGYFTDIIEGTFEFLKKKMFCLFEQMSKHDFFQADHALYTPGLDENRVIGDFVHDIWICYEVHCTKFLYMHLKHLLSDFKFSDLR